MLICKAYRSTELIHMRFMDSFTQFPKLNKHRFYFTICRYWISSRIRSTWSRPSTAATRFLLTLQKLWRKPDISQ